MPKPRPVHKCTFALQSPSPGCSTRIRITGASEENHLSVKQRLVINYYSPSSGTSVGSPFRTETILLSERGGYMLGRPGCDSIILPAIVVMRKCMKTCKVEWHPYLAYISGVPPLLLNSIESLSNLFPNTQDPTTAMAHPNVSKMQESTPC